MDPTSPSDRSAPGLARRLARLVPAVLPLAILLVTGLAGLDFGRHWDERLRLNSLRQAVENETLLPDAYNYPSLPFWLGVAALAPEVLGDLPTHPTEFAELQRELGPFVMGEEFRLRLRGVFLVLSSLMVLWVYLAHLRWRGRAGEALLAATLAGLSFEFAYHARWIAPDMVNNQFAALCLLLCLCAFGSPRPRTWLLGATVVAGLATGTKYTAGMLLVPVLTGLVLAVLAARRARRAPGAQNPFTTATTVLDPRPWSTLGLALVLFVATFLATTPGALLQPFSFYRDVRFEMWHYGEKGHFGFTIEAGLPHLVAQLRYLAGAALSPIPALSFALFLLVPIGAAALVRESRPLAALILAFPLLFLLYMSGQVVFFVRNPLLVLPFLALLGARGAAALGAVSPWAPLRHLPLGLALVLLGVHGGWLAWAAGTIRDRAPERVQARFVPQLDRWLARREGELVYLDPRLLPALELHAARERPNLTHDPLAPARWAVVLPPANLGLLERLPSNRPGSIRREFGPRVVNREYYWTWRDPQILVTSLEYARASGLVPDPGRAPPGEEGPEEPGR